MKEERGKVRSPVFAVQGGADRLAIQPHLPCDGRDRLAPGLGLAYRLPLRLPNHIALRVQAAP